MKWWLLFFSMQTSQSSQSTLHQPKMPRNKKIPHLLGLKLQCFKKPNLTRDDLSLYFIPLSLTGKTKQVITMNGIIQNRTWLAARLKSWYRSTQFGLYFAWPYLATPKLRKFHPKSNKISEQICKSPRDP